MAVIHADGASGGGAYSWSMDYDDVAQQLTLRADGVGWGAVVVRRANNQSYTAVFLQPGQDPNVPVRANEPSPASLNPIVTVEVGSGSQSFPVAARVVNGPHGARFVIDQAPWFPPAGWVAP